MSFADEAVLWWAMVLTGCSAAGLSLLAVGIGRRGGVENAVGRYWLHMASYVLLSLSILVFVARGLMLS